IRPSNSQWSSPLHLVRKNNGDWRPCGDYRRVNAQTRADRYPIPHLHDFAFNLDSCRVFTSIDLVKAYHQIQVAEEDIPKTAIITPFGLFEFLRMPFGLKTASQTFQRFMNQVTHGLDFVYVYLDDILVASRNEEEHARHLDILFERLNSHGLSINLEKCHFAVPELTFLGHRVSKDGITVLSERLEAIDQFPQPTTRK